VVSFLSCRGPQGPPQVTLSYVSSTAREEEVEESVDKKVNELVEWFDLEEARRRLKAAQVPFLDRLQAAVASTPNRSSAHDVGGASRDQRDGEAGDGRLD